MDRLSGPAVVDGAAPAATSRGGAGGGGLLGGTPRENAGGPVISGGCCWPLRPTWSTTGDAAVLLIALEEVGFVSGGGVSRGGGVEKGWTNALFRIAPVPKS